MFFIMRRLMGLIAKCNCKLVFVSFYNRILLWLIFCFRRHSCSFHRFLAVGVSFSILALAVSNMLNSW